MSVWGHKLLRKVFEATKQMYSLCFLTDYTTGKQSTSKVKSLKQIFHQEISD